MKSGGIGLKHVTFNGDLSILVNGSPTDEIKIQRGLKQGDPLAPFLFLMVAEGLSGLVRSAVSRGVFKVFRVGDGAEEVSILQYADDTLFVGEVNWGNLWALKSILMCFELASGLKVNFHKSCIIGINVEENFSVAASLFLNCKYGAVPFKYLGLPIGANPRLMSTWQSVLDSMGKRLSSWKRRHLSLGGRITLINSVLNSLLTYFLPFLKIPKQVLSKMIKTEELSLGGRDERRKIAWAVLSNSSHGVLR